MLSSVLGLCRWLLVQAANCTTAYDASDSWEGGRNLRRFSVVCGVFRLCCLELKPQHSTAQHAGVQDTHTIRAASLYHNVYLDPVSLADLASVPIAYLQITHNRPSGSWITAFIADRAREGGSTQVSHGESNKGLVVCCVCAESGCENRDGWLVAWGFCG